MAQNDAFYWRVTFGYGEIVFFDVIQTMRLRESGYLYDSRWYKPTVTKEASFLVADTRLYTLPCWKVGRSVCPSVHPSVTFLNSEQFLHYCSCPTVRDWIAVYPALFGIYPCSC